MTDWRDLCASNWCDNCAHALPRPTVMGVYLCTVYQVGVDWGYDVDRFARNGRLARTPGHWRVVGEYHKNCPHHSPLASIGTIETGPPPLEDSCG